MVTLTDFFPALPSNFIYTLILPFIILFTIFWAVLSAMRIFHNKVNTVLALALTLTIFFTGGFDIFTTFLFQSTTTLAAVIFVLLFVFGIISWAVGRTRDIYYSTGGADAKIRRIQKKIADLEKKHDQESDPDKRNLIAREIHDLEIDLKMAERERSRVMSP